MFLCVESDPTLHQVSYVNLLSVYLGSETVQWAWTGVPSDFGHRDPGVSGQTDQGKVSFNFFLFFSTCPEAGCKYFPVQVLFNNGTSILFNKKSRSSWEYTNVKLLLCNVPVWYLVSIASRGSGSVSGLDPYSVGSVPYPTPPPHKNK